MIKLNFQIEPNREKIACFDLDHTLIKPKSGKTFPIDKNDWTWIYSNVPVKLKELYDDNFNKKLVNYNDKNLIIFAFNDDNENIRKESIIPLACRKLLDE